MKRLVVYHSSTGFTKQYAEWIAKELNCEAVAENKLTKQKLTEQEMIIFGGWVMGNMIMGLDKIRKKYTGKLVVFAVGASELSSEVIQDITVTSHIGDLPFFYMQGGLRLEKLGFVKRKMLEFVRSNTAKKAEKTEKEKYMEKVLANSFDASDRKNIKLLVDYLSVE